MINGTELISAINDCRVPAGRCAFWWLGQHSFVVKLADTIIYIDPFLSALEGRQVPSLLQPADVTNAHVILGSHDHVDHIDRDVWPGLAQASPKAVFITPKLIHQQVADELHLDTQRVLGVDDGICVEVEGITIRGVPAAHEFLEVDPSTGLHRFIGFVIEGNDFCVYHAGDTCIYEGMHAILRRWRLDLAFLPINGRDAYRLSHGVVGNMTFQEAADLAGAIRPGLTVPAHFDMFAMNSVDPHLFADYMAVKHSKVRTLIPDYGQTVIVERSLNSQSHY